MTCLATVWSVKIQGKKRNKSSYTVQMHMQFFDMLMAYYFFKFLIIILGGIKWKD